MATSPFPRHQDNGELGSRQPRPCLCFKHKGPHDLSRICRWEPMEIGSTPLTVNVDTILRLIRRTQRRILVSSRNLFHEGLDDQRDVTTLRQSCLRGLVVLWKGGILAGMSNRQAAHRLTGIRVVHDEITFRPKSDSSSECLTGSRHKRQNPGFYGQKGQIPAVMGKAWGLTKSSTSFAC